MPARYVVGMNDTRPTRAARTWAAERASAAGVPLLLVHVEETRAGHVRESAAATPARHARDGRTIVLHGPTPQALAAFLHDDDLLVIGTDKTGFIHARVFGARGVQIVAAVRGSIAVIPEVDLRFRSGIVAGIDRDETAALILRPAGAAAAARAEPLQLIHSSFDDTAPTAATAAGSVLARAASAGKELWPDLVIRARATARPPAEALLDAARNAALLVLGSGADRAGSAIESVVHDVLVNINAPVLIVRPEPSQKRNESIEERAFSPSRPI